MDQIKYERVSLGHTFVVGDRATEYHTADLVVFLLVLLIVVWILPRLPGGVD